MKIVMDRLDTYKLRDVTPAETRTTIILYRTIKYFISDLIFNYKLYRIEHAIHLNWIVVGAVGNIILCILNLINLWRHWE